MRNSPSPKIDKVTRRTRLGIYLASFYHDAKEANPTKPRRRPAPGSPCPGCSRKIHENQNPKTISTASHPHTARIAAPGARGRLLALALLTAVGSAHGADYQWNGTSTSTWSTPGNWSPAGTFFGRTITAGPAQTGATFAHRLNVLNGAGSALIYDGSLGTTVYANSASGQRGLVMSSGTAAPASSFTITGGSFSTLGSNGADVIGNSTTGGTTSVLTVNGGTFIGSGAGTIVNFGGTNNVATLNLLSSTSTATLTTLTVSNSGGSGTVNLDGGTLAVNLINKAGTGTFNFNGGTLKARVPSATFFSDFATTTANVKSGGAIIDTSGDSGTGVNVTIGEALVDGGGGGGLTKNGAGILTLSGANTYTGPTVINAGTLAFSRTGTVTLNGGSISGAGGVNFLGGATFNLAGNHTYNGPTSVAAGRLNLDGTLTSNISVTTGASIGGEGSTTGSLTFTGTHNVFFDPGTPAKLTAGSINATGAAVSFAPYGTLAATPGVVVLEAAGGITGTIGSEFLENSRVDLYYNFGQTQLLANYVPGTLVWQGSDITNPTFWNTDGTPNWLNGASADKFFAADIVQFDDSATSASPVLVDIQGTVLPSAVTFANNAKNYEIGVGAIGGTSAVTFNGSGQVTFNADNTYSGGTTINSGTVVSSALGAFGAGGVTVANGATLNLTSTAPGVVGYTGISSSLSGAGTVNVSLANGTNTRNFNGNNSAFTGTLNIGDGVATGKIQLNGAIGAATINVATNATVYVGAAVTHPAAITLNGGDTGESLGQLRLDNGSTWSGDITLAGDITGLSDGNIGSNAANLGTISGDIGQTGGPRDLVKAGGGVIFLNGTNTYTGQTRILAGGLVISSVANALGTTAAGTVVGINGGLGLSGGITFNAAETLTISGPGFTNQAGTLAVQRGALQSVSGNNSWNQNITLASGSTNNRIGVQDGAQLTLNGNIVEDVGGTMLAFRHGNTAGSNITINGTGNSWTGETHIFGGEGAVILGVDNALPTGSLLRVGTTGIPGTGSTLDLNGNDQTTAGIARVQPGLSFVTNNGSGTSTLTLNPATNLDFGGVIQDGSSPIQIVKTGPNSQLFSGINTYTGTTQVNEGTLGVTGSLGLTAVTVGGATAPVAGTPTLTGVGNIAGTVTIAAASGGAAGIVNPGTVGGIGILPVGGTTINGTYACDINATSADSLTVTGDLDLTGATLALNQLAAPTAASYTIATYTGALTGTFTASPALPAGYALDYTTPNQIKLVKAGFASWITGTFANGTVPGGQQGENDDPDGDGASNLVEFAFDGDPTTGANNGRIHALTVDSDADGDSDPELVLTLAVRSTVGAFTGATAKSASVDGITYTIEGSTTLDPFATQVNVVPTALPPSPSTIGPDYVWKSFSLEGSNGLPGKGFLRAKVTAP